MDVLCVPGSESLYTLPSAAAIGKGTYRSQLGAYLKGTYGERSRVAGALESASVHRAREQSSATVFLAQLIAAGEDDFVAGSGFVRLQTGMDSVL